MKSNIFVCLIILFACGANRTENMVSSSAESLDTSGYSDKEASFISTEGVYFKANGIEPFWSLEVSEKMIKFNTPDDSIQTPHLAPLYSANGDTVSYKLETERAILNFSIEESTCINSMSGVSSPFNVTLDYRLTSENIVHTEQGCGRYFTDSRLHDIWVLEEIQGNDVHAENYSGELPNVEIDIRNNTFSGYSGCNRMNGSLSFQFGKIKFSNIASTRRACPQHTNSERELLDLLRNWHHYTIDRNRLNLFENENPIVVFKKVD